VIARGQALVPPLVALAVAAQQPRVAERPADTILVNGHVITVDARFSIAEAIAISDGKFTAVGSSASIRRHAGPATRVIDLHGETVIPGLADGHLHDAGGGPGVDLAGARSIADVLAAVAARVARSRPGDLIVTPTATGTRRSLPSTGCRIVAIWTGLPRTIRWWPCGVATSTSSTPRR